MTEWRKSSRSQSGSDCVELRVKEGENVGVRDSKNPNGRRLTLSPVAFASFIDATVNGQITR